MQDPAGQEAQRRTAAMSEVSTPLYDLGRYKQVRERPFGCSLPAALPHMRTLCTKSRSSKRLTKSWIHCA